MQNKKRHASIKANLKGVVPVDAQWGVLQEIMNGCKDYISEEASTSFHGAIRARDINKYLATSDAFAPQCIAFNDDMHSEKFAAEYQLSAFLRKYPFKGSSDSRQRSAVDGFLKAEQSCSDYNKSGYKSVLSLNPAYCMEEALPLMRSFIERVLTNSVNIEECFATSRHGPGGSLDTIGDRISAYYKWSSFPYSVTKSAVPYAKLLISSDERWLQAIKSAYHHAHPNGNHCVIDMQVIFKWAFRVVKGNKITFVPKDARKDRPIAIEPLLNMMLQLGVDGYIRTHLKTVGVNLDSQEKNQYFAYLGSCLGNVHRFSTIDLSAA